MMRIMKDRDTESSLYALLESAARCSGIEIQKRKSDAVNRLQNLTSRVESLERELASIKQEHASAVKDAVRSLKSDHCAADRKLNDHRLDTIDRHRSGLVRDLSIQTHALSSARDDVLHMQDQQAENLKFRRGLERLRESKKKRV